MEKLHTLCGRFTSKAALQNWINSSSVADQFLLGNQEDSSASGSSNRLAGVEKRDVLTSLR